MTLAATAVSTATRLHAGSPGLFALDGLALLGGSLLDRRTGLALSATQSAQH